MQYLKCKCGKMESWTTEGILPCQFCSDCGTTLAGDPKGHREPTPHKFIREVRERNGIPKIQLRCLICHHIEDDRDDVKIAKEDTEHVKIVKNALRNELECSE